MNGSPLTDQEIADAKELLIRAFVQPDGQVCVETPTHYDDVDPYYCVGRFVTPNREEARDHVRRQITKTHNSVWFQRGL